MIEQEILEPEDWMIIQNLLWSEERDLLRSLHIYDDPNKYARTHEYVAKTTEKLRNIGNKIDTIINNDNGHPYWWREGVK